MHDSPFASVVRKFMQRVEVQADSRTIAAQNLFGIIRTGGDIASIIAVSSEEVDAIGEGDERVAGTQRWSAMTNGSSRHEPYGQGGIGMVLLVRIGILGTVTIVCHFVVVGGD